MQGARRIWGVWVLLVLLILGLAAPILSYPLGRDQGEFAAIAVQILRGAVPYVEVWNPKPPAIFYTYAAAIALFGQTALAPRTLDLIAFPLMALALMGIGRRLGGAALGLWAVLLYGVFYFGETFWTLSQNDGIAALPMAYAVWLLLSLQDTALNSRAALWRAFGVGLLAALTLWFKYPFVTLIAAWVLGYLGLRRRWLWREVGAFVAGGLLVGVGGILALASAGALGAWWQSALVTSGYTAQSYDWALLVDELRKALGFRWAAWHILWILAALWVPVRLLKPSALGGGAWGVVGLWLGGALLAMLIQAKGYDYHWLPMLPALALFGAGTLTHILQAHPNPPLRWLNVGGAVLLLAALLGARTWGTALPYLSGVQSQADYYAGFVGGEFRADESLAVVEYLRANGQAGAPLYVWGFRPEIYYLAQMPPATRFIFQFPLVGEWYPSEWQQQNVDVLWAALPPYVLVVRGDFMAWVTGKNADSNMLLQEYTELNNWLMFNYTPQTEIGSFVVWQRNPS